MTVGNVSATTGTAGLDPTSLSGLLNGGTLSSEDIILFCATRLNDMDADIKAQMAKQDDRAARMKALNALNSALSNYPNTPGVPRDCDAAQKVIEAYKDAYDSYPPGSPERAQLEQQFEDFRKNACNAHQDTWGQDSVPPHDYDPDGKAGSITLDNMKRPGEPGALPGGDASAIAHHDPADTGKRPIDCPKDGPNPYDFTDKEKQGLVDSSKNLINSAGEGKELDMINLQSIVSQREMVVQMATNMMSKMNEGTNTIVNNLK